MVHVGRIPRAAHGPRDPVGSVLLYDNTLHGKLKECPSCALDVDEDAAVCPYCRYEFPQQRSSLKVAALVMALLLLWPLIELLRWLFG